MSKNTKAVVNGTKASFTMAVSGGDLPDDFKAYIATTIDFASASQEDLITCCAGGQSARVMLQGQLRRKPKAELIKLGENGLNTTLADIMKGTTVSFQDRLMMLSLEEFIIEMEILGLDEEQAISIYNRKHGIEE